MKSPFIHKIKKRIFIDGEYLMMLGFVKYVELDESTLRMHFRKQDNVTNIDITYNQLTEDYSITRLNYSVGSCHVETQKWHNVNDFSVLKDVLETRREEENV